MASVLGDFVDILVGGIVDLAQGVASGVTTMADKLFLVHSAEGATSLSVFGGICAIFAGIALATGITRLVYMWIVSLGGKK